MTVWGKSESLCQKAQEYYYELLCQNDAAVPEAIIRHVEGCSFCREQIHRLQEALAQGDSQAGSSQGPGNNRAIEALSRHFEFLDEPVHCSQVKPFLPELLISSRRIRIPTPITVHVDNCPECARDMASIRELGLGAGQLRRLSQFYGRVADPDPLQCPSAQPAAAGLAAFSLDGADSRTLDHVSLCPHCRTWVYQQRARAMADRNARAGGPNVLACADVSTADLFDFVLPFGLDPVALGRTSGRRDAVATHVRACPRCMEKVQSLHRTLYAVAERADSAVWTVCRTDESDADPSDETQTPAYRYPIHVQVLRQEPAPAAVGHGLGASSGSGRTASAGWRSMPRRRIAVVAIAVVVGGLLTVVPRSTATGMSVGGVRKAIERMTNVHMAKFHGGDSTPFFEMFLAVGRQTVVTKVGPERTLYDFRTRRMTVFRPDKAPRTAPLPASGFGSCEEFMTQIFETIFVNVSEKDSLSETEYVASDQPGEYWAVYELTQTGSQRDGLPRLGQWRVFFNSVRQVPEKIEYIARPSAPDLAPAQVQVTRLRHLTRSQMDDAITALSSAE